MDPLGVVQTVLSAISYLRAMADKVKENKSECKRLCDHAGTLLDLIQSECKSGVPYNLSHRLSKLANTLLDLSTTIEELSQRSLFQRTVLRDSVSAGIQKAYRDISDAVQELNLGLQIDLRRFQQENEDARRADAEESKKYFERILQNGDDVLQELQVQKLQMQEAMMCLHQYLITLPQSVERRFLETGMFAMQRRSGPMKQVPDEFVITSFDVIVHHDKKLGEGGFATVYEADWKGSRVAVKQLEKGVPPSAIQQEINVWKQLRHPHIVEFFGACTIAEPAFIVCALQQNGDIINYLREHPDTDRRKLLHDASLGLVYLHHNNVVHGDLKGTNVLVSSQGRACLADFGLSRIKIHSTTIRRTKHVAEYGTLRWMSPESMLLGVSNRKTDIYSFGMTMYEVFTGRPPFASVPDQTLLSIVHDRGARPPRPEKAYIRDVGLDNETWTVITLCWAQKPQDRIVASDVAHRLEAIVMSQEQLLLRQELVAASESIPRAPRARSRKELNNNEVPPPVTPVTRELLETQLSDNPLGLSDMIPAEELERRASTPDIPRPQTPWAQVREIPRPQTPWARVPRDLNEREHEYGEKDPSMSTPTAHKDPYSSHEPLRLTFSPSIVRTPDHYDMYDRRINGHRARDDSETMKRGENRDDSARISRSRSHGPIYGPIPSGSSNPPNDVARTTTGEHSDADEPDLPVIPSLDLRLQMLSSAFLPNSHERPKQLFGGFRRRQEISLSRSTPKLNPSDSSPSWTLSADEGRIYDYLFRAWDPRGEGFISELTAVEMFGQSGLDKDDLARIWFLADADNRGKLNRDEFKVAMGLVYRRLNGEQIPEQLPQDLVLSSRRKPEPSTGKIRRGYWNKRGDHLVETAETSHLFETRQYIVYAPSHLSYPEELSSYPEPAEGWMDHDGSIIRYDHYISELPESVANGDAPPSRPYESFIQYVVSMATKS